MKYLLIFYCSCLITLSSSLAQQKSKTESILSGSEIYNDFCIRCHLVNGEGVKGTFPPLRKSDYLLKNIDKSIAGLKYGMKGKIKVNNIIIMSTEQKVLMEKYQKWINEKTASRDRL